MNAIKLTPQIALWAHKYYSFWGYVYLCNGTQSWPFIRTHTHNRCCCCWCVCPYEIYIPFYRIGKITIPYLFCTTPRSLFFFFTLNFLFFVERMVNTQIKHKFHIDNNERCCCCCSVSVIPTDREFQKKMKFRLRRRYFVNNRRRSEWMREVWQTDDLKCSAEYEQVWQLTLLMRIRLNAFNFFFF